jgi:hypothetical protein
MDEFLTTQEAAAFIKYGVSTLENWRAEGKGPKYFKPQDKVLYAKSDLIEWVKGEEK